MIELLIAGVLVASAAAFGVFVTRRLSRSRAKALPAPKESTVRPQLMPATAAPGLGEGEDAIYDPKPADITPGDEVQFMLPEDLEASFYSVTAANLYERGDADTWTEFAVQEMDGERSFYLIYSEDEDDGWGWSASAVIDDGDVEAVDELRGVEFDKRLPPPEVLQLFDATWRATQGAHHKKVQVTEWARGEDEENYKARLTDYREVGGDRELSVEVWKGGLNLSISAGPATEVIVIKNREGER